MSTPPTPSPSSGLEPFAVAVDGVRLTGVRRAGAGSTEGPTIPPVVLLHGFTGSALAWGEPLLQALSGTPADMVAIDLPGHGGSSLASSPLSPVEGGAPLGVAGVADLLPHLLDALGLDRVTLVGYSMGGRVALATALRHPHRVGALILESSSPGLTSAAEREARRGADEALASALERGGMGPFVERWLALPLFSGLRRLPVEERTEERERRMRNRPEALAAVLRAMGPGANPPLHDRLGELQIPVLLIAGGEDERYRQEAERMRGAIPGAESCIIPGVGHVPHREEPAGWLDAVQVFLRRSPG